MTTPTDVAYRERILGLVRDADPLASLEASADRVERVARDLGSSGLTRPWAEGKWSGLQLLAHLADVELGVGFRVRQILAEQPHTIQILDEQAWARVYQDVDAEAALASFRASRRWNLWLFRKLGPAELARVGDHPDRGPETLDVIVRMLAGHDLNHLAQLEKIAG